MAYDFVGKKIATSMNGAKNSRVYTQTLLGQTIDENPVPEWTADPLHSFPTRRSSDLRSICDISESKKWESMGI